VAVRLHVLLLEAHTPREIAENAATAAENAANPAANTRESQRLAADQKLIQQIGDDWQLAKAIKEIGDELAREPDQFDLIADDIEPVGSLEIIAENSHAVRRARERGRPKGAANKRNDKVFDYLEACGHRDPATTLSLLQSADTLALAKHLRMDTKDVLANQIKAAAALMPYKYAKKPVDVHVTDKRERPIMVIGTMNNTQINVADDGVRSIGEPRGQAIENAEQNQSDDL
ncbi:MAG: hypothetical protein U5K75_00005, partial [Ahrensia sp.]|nr:hypothetical protein [Ahrensia sp.]